MLVWRSFSSSSCSLCGGRELLAKLQDAVGGDPDVQVRGFECLGACDIAPMVSVDGVYVGPVADDEVDALAQQIRDGDDPLPAKQLIRRPSVDPGANTQEWPGWEPAPEVILDSTATGNTPLPPEPSEFGRPMSEPSERTDADTVAPTEQAPMEQEGPAQDEGTP